MAIEDPFGPPAQVEAAPAPVEQDPPAQTFTPPAVVAATAPVVSTGTAGDIVITFKEGNGYDASWVVVRAATVAEADALLDQQFAGLLDKTKRVAGYFRGAATPGAVVAAAPSNPSAPPAGATQAPGNQTRQCKHGQMQYKSGFSAKTNKTWQAFMCPTPKGTPDQCDAEWIRD